MRRLLNTLYVMTQKSYLAHEGENVLVRIEASTRLRVPVHTLQGIVCFGQVSCSPSLLRLCCARGVSVSFMSLYGRFWARVQGQIPGNVLLRRRHYRCADDPETTAEVARALVLGKVANCRLVLLRALRDHTDHPHAGDLEQASRYLARIGRILQKQASVDVIRGHEGEAAKSYFGVFDHLITAQKGDFSFRMRTRKPPLDNVNSILSFVYTLLAHDVSSALESVGLDPAVGFLHKDRPGRHGLALDLMEELRPVIADRVTLTLINRRQIQGRDFVKTETGAVMMSDEARKTVLRTYQERKQESLYHPFLDEKFEIGMIPFAQALLMARFLRGDLEAYPPFLWR
ncbi:type I-C CRISPR-associated endonuclease Cas1 [bacterium]|nr:type I-C CRISPR-associated endonuclease Cas1 [candidate division CSSED10-310 bacterium]